MAQAKTFKCSNCGTEISANGITLFCPNCKKPIVAAIVIWLITVVLMVIIVIIAIKSVNNLLHTHDQDLKDLYGYHHYAVAINCI